MSSESISPQEMEAVVLEKLRKQYEEQGFDFILHPAPAQVPAFLGNYRPDALATKPGTRLVIEVKGTQNHSTERSLREIRKLFEGQEDWKFVVIYGRQPFPTSKIQAPSEDEIRTHLTGVRVLLSQGHRRAALVMAWSLMEAALNRLQSDAGKARTPGTVIEHLSSLGYLTPEAQAKLRPLISLRNRIVHGDVAAEPDNADIDTLLDAIEQSLSIED